MPSMETTPSPPHHRTGLLSRTFSSSSTIRWILPARIRSSTKNDVVFVGETFVQLREFLNSGQLADATAKLDFGTQILAARVISAKVEIVPTIDAILKQERDQEQYSIHGRPVEDSHPPQLLVLSTFSNELIYIYAKEDSSGDARFVFAKKSLLRGMTLPIRQCRHMAVDHEYVENVRQNNLLLTFAQFPCPGHSVVQRIYSHFQTSHSRRHQVAGRQLGSTEAIFLLTLDRGECEASKGLR